MYFSVLRGSKLPMLMSSFVRCISAFAWVLLASTVVVNAQPGPTPFPQGQPVTSPSGIATPLLGTVPASIVGSGTWVSACVPIANWRAYSIYVGMAGAATLQTQRFADSACTLRIGAAVPASPQALAGTGCVGGTALCGSFTQNDGVPAMFMQLTVTDTSTATNTIRGVVLILGAK